MTSPRSASTTAGALTTSMTAHPKIDPATGRMHSFGYSFAPPYLTYHVIRARRAARLSRGVAVAGSTMMHDRDYRALRRLLGEAVVFDTAAISTGMPYRWSPSTAPGSASCRSAARPR
jgi:carotenoid cleavage dioxygenase